MGNHSLRKQAALALKKIGAPKLWKKPRHGLGHTLYDVNAKELREIIRITQLKPGDIVSSCDGFNHVIKHPIKWKRSWSGLIYNAALKYDDMEYTCGCTPPQPPRSVEEITKELLLNLDDSWSNWPKYSKDEKVIKFREDLISGYPVVNELGMLKAKYRMN